MLLYIPDLRVRELNRPVSDHALSMRLRGGDEIEATDLRGARAHVCIQYVDRAKGVIQFEVCGEVEHIPNTYQSVLYIARLDKHYLDKLIEIIPLTMFRTVVIFGGDYSVPGGISELYQDRMHNILVRSCEQCHRVWLPELKYSINLEACMATATLSQSVVLDCSSHEQHNLLFAQMSTCDVFIGPEGGWSDRERKLFALSGVQKVSLGPIIYPAWVTPLVWASKYQVTNT